MYFAVQCDLSLRLRIIEKTGNTFSVMTQDPLAIFSFENKCYITNCHACLKQKTRMIIFAILSILLPVFVNPQVTSRVDIDDCVEGGGNIYDCFNTVSSILHHSCIISIEQPCMVSVQVLVQSLSLTFFDSLLGQGLGLF